MRELFSEFVEDWLGYDSKIYKTAAQLAKPAALSLDYFANSHHKNHYITPIRLYLLLSIIFFLMTNFGGLRLTEIEFNDVNNNPQAQKELQKAESELNKAIDNASSTQEKEALQTALETIKEQSEEIPTPEQAEKPKAKSQGGSFTITGKDDFNTKTGCSSNSAEIFNLWPQWLDNKVDNGVQELCDSYAAILLLPEFERNIAKRNFGLSLGQKAIEMIPQVFFLSLPILALVLSIFYFLSKRLYVEHLVLLMHSHSFIFAVVLFYLGWYQLSSLWSPLSSFWMEELLSLVIIVYLYLSQKWFYQRGWWATLWRFLLFGLLYAILITILTSIGVMFGIIIGAD